MYVRVWVYLWVCGYCPARVCGCVGVGVRCPEADACMRVRMFAIPPRLAPKFSGSKGRMEKNSLAKYEYLKGSVWRPPAVVTLLYNPNPNKVGRIDMNVIAVVLGRIDMNVIARLITSKQRFLNVFIEGS